LKPLKRCRLTHELESLRRTAIAPNASNATATSRSGARPIYHLGYGTIYKSQGLWFADGIISTIQVAATTNYAYNIIGDLTQEVQGISQTGYVYTGRTA